MPNTNIDLNAAIDSMVRTAVKNALAPHLGALDRLTSFLGAGKTAAAGKRTWGARTAGRPAQRKDYTKRTLAARGDASKFSKGDKVAIAVGRGSDTGVVTAIDVATGSVMVKRDKGGKVVKRPASSVRAR